MDAASILLVILAAGVNFGWQPADDAPEELEYIVQMEPELLDALREGAALPIESNVPPDIGPIRKVSVVVGRGDLPRTAVGAIRRTSHFAGETGWAPDRYNSPAPAATTASAYDRYGPPPGAANSAIGPPPSVVDRAQSAVNETATTLRDGVEAGIQAANEQFTRSGGQVLDATRNAGQEFGRQLQGWTNDPAGQLQATGDSVRAATERTLGTVGNQLQQTTNPFVGGTPPPTAARTQSRGSVAPPPWPAAATTTTAAVTPSNSPAQAGNPPSAGRMAPQQTATGWSSIGSNVAAPPPPAPPMDTRPETSASTPSQVAASQGPTIPELPPLAAPANGADEWANGWGADAASQATISRNAPTAIDGSGRQSELVSVQPVPGEANRDPQTASPSDDFWADAQAWNQSSTTANIAAQGPNYGAITTDNANRSQPELQRPGLTDEVPNIPGQSATIDLARQPAGTLPASNQLPVASPADQPPWLPLLLVSLSLMGSLSANLFLGWSYMDARQKYRTLVRKTADKFRRATAA